MYKSFEEMPVWMEAFSLADEIYDYTEKFPKNELFSLTEQLFIILLEALHMR